MNQFCHLHLHTEYSMLDGYCRLEDLFEAANKLGMDALAITDHHNVSGVVSFFQLAVKYQIKPIIGVELNIGSILPGGPEKRYHLTVLAKDNLGYRTILQLITRANLKNDGIVTAEMLEAHHQGLIVLCGCAESELAEWIYKDFAQAKEVARRYHELLGQNNYYLELQRLGVAGEEEGIARRLKIAQDLQIPVVATNNVHYIKKADSDTHRALSAIQKLSLEASYPDKLRDEYYLKSADEMAVLFHDIPEAVENTVKIAERCNVVLDLEQLHFPQFPVPAQYTRESYLRHLCYQGMQERYGKKAGSNVLERLEFELDVISRMGYAGYFLIMWDIVQYARQQGILTAGRGSAVSSLVCYLLKITTIDPLKFELYFERFLNPERTSMPDIDLDIDHIGRKQILHYIAEKYGLENMAHLSAFSTLAARAAVRDVARVQGWPEEKLTPLTRFIAHQNIHDIESPTNGADFKETYYRNAAFRRLINTAQHLEGLPRHLTQHSAGVVISPDSLTNYTALEFARDGEVITQFDMRAIESLGLLKIDLLGVRFMSAIRFTLKLLKETRGLDLTMEQIPLDDPKTYQLIQAGDTIGCFQLESGGCRKLLQQLKPANLKEVMFATSLYRPGPIEGGMVQSFVARLHKEEEIEYPHPLLADLLKDTFGVVLFQEQVMLIARDMAGFTLGEADVLRKAISKKDLTVWAEQRSKFVNGACARGLSAAEANQIFDKLHKFAGYGFCKAHAAAYAYVAYITSYLKTHFPVEYLTSLFNVNLDFDCRVRQYLNQARYRNIPVLPPDINDSELLVTTDGEKIRMGFLLIRGLGRKAAEEVLRVRENGLFTSLSDFCRRVDLGLVHQNMLESLIKAGAFDGLGARLELLWSSAKIWQEAKEHHVSEGQLCCLPYQTKVQAFNSSMPELDLIEILRWEIETMGHPISASPLVCLAGQENVTPLNCLHEVPGKLAWIAGEITALRFRWTQKGTLVAFFTLEDMTGTAEVTVFEPYVTRYKKVLFSGNTVKVKVKLEKRTSIYDLLLEEIVPL